MSNFLRDDPYDAYKAAHDAADTDINQHSIHHTLGPGSHQAAPGSSSADSGWVDLRLSNGRAPVNGSSPFSNSVFDHLKYRKVGPLIELVLKCRTTAAWNQSSVSSGNFGNVAVVGAGSVPSNLLPTYFAMGNSRLNDAPVVAGVNVDGSIPIVGGLPVNWPTNANFELVCFWFVDS